MNHVNQLFFVRLISLVAAVGAFEAVIDGSWIRGALSAVTATLRPSFDRIRTSAHNNAGPSIHVTQLEGPYAREVLLAALRNEAIEIYTRLRLRDPDMPEPEVLDGVLLQIKFAEAQIAVARGQDSQLLVIAQALNDFINSNRSPKIEIRGIAPLGTPCNDFYLVSEERAASLITELVKFGVSRASLMPRGHMPDRCKEPNEGELETEGVLLIPHL